MRKLKGEVPPMGPDLLTHCQSYLSTAPRLWVSSWSHQVGLIDLPTPPIFCSHTHLSISVSALTFLGRFHTVPWLPSIFSFLNLTSRVNYLVFFDVSLTEKTLSALWAETTSCIVSPTIGGEAGECTAKRTSTNTINLHDKQRALCLPTSAPIILWARKLFFLTFA